MEATRQVWDLFAKLYSLAAQPEVKITEQQWLYEARQFGMAFVKRYPKEDVTPYIHVFVYHVGFYLERFGSLEKFANYAIESQHFLNKKTHTNGYSIPLAGKNACYQELTYSWRSTYYKANQILVEPPRKKRRTSTTPKSINWASRIIRCHPDMWKYLPLHIQESLTKEKEQEQEKEKEREEQGD